MKSQRVALTLAKLVGRWETDERDSAAVFEIAIASGKPILNVFDSRDGERARVTGVEWDGKALSFATHWPSTDWHARHRFIPTKKAGLVRHELTLIELWKRVRVRRSANRRTSR